MSKPIITIHNVETGEIESREMNDVELATYQDTLATIKAQEELKAQAEMDKAALLAKLGITADEAKLLLGGN
jgi:hypothetical protein